ncbi:MAG: MGMT family protein [Candidatus Moranbacteria bacterium]|nr:MGMT family protein [Candidatus Moranbacteria bacterium]
MKRLSKNISQAFSDLVYAKTKLVPRGRVTTYGQIAKAIGKSKASRAVGNALNCNPYVPVVPCHRVVKSNGEIGGFVYGTRAKAGLLAKEEVKVKDGKVVDFEKKLFVFGK